MDPNVLLQTLSNTLSADETTRKTAERGLKELEVQPKYAVTLCQIALNLEVHFTLRQLAAVVLKQFVKKHWHPDNDLNAEIVDLSQQQQQQQAQRHIVIPPEDKAFIRKVIPQALSDPSTKISTAMGMVISEIATYDFPEEWPTLLDEILQKFTSVPPDHPQAYAAMRCLSLVGEHFGSDQVAILMRMLLPNMMAIVKDNKYPDRVKARALTVAYCIFTLLGISIEDAENAKELQQLLKAALPSWVQLLSTIASAKMTSNHNFAIKREALKVLTSLIRNFPKSIKPHLKDILQHIWASLVSELPTYEQQIVSGEGEEDAEFDSEGESLGLETFVIQEFELIHTVAGNPLYKSLIQPHLKTLSYYVIGYMQMTLDQLDAWESDPNQFVANEDDDTFNFNVRISGQELLNELVEVYDVEALVAISQSIMQRLSESAQKFADKDENWWKLRECALLAAGTIAEEMADYIVNSKDKVKNVLDITGLLNTLLTQDLSEGAPVYLRARALWLASRFSDMFDDKLASAFLQASVAGLDPKQPIPVRVSACRALANLVPDIKESVLVPFFPHIMQGMAHLLTQATEDTLHLVIETLSICIKTNPQELNQTNMMVGDTDLTVVAMNIWSKYNTDPLITMDIVELLQMLAKSPYAVERMKQTVLPTIISFIQQPDNFTQTPHILETAVEVLTLIVNGCKSSGDMELLIQTTFGPMVSLVLASDDNAILQNGSECLRAFVHYGYQQLATLQLPGGASPLQLLVQVVAKLLNPSISDSGALCVGGLIVEIIHKLGATLASVLGEILTAVVQRLYVSRMPSLIQALILVFAHLVHSHMNDLLNFLEHTHVGDKNENALSYVMKMWSREQLDIFGSYEIKVSTTAIAKLLASRDPRLYSLSVPVEQQVTQAKTRAKAKKQQEQRKEVLVPFPARAIYLLAQAYLREEEEAVARAKRASRYSGETGQWEDSDDSGNDSDEDFGHGDDDDGDDDEDSPFADVNEYSKDIELSALIAQAEEDEDDEDHIDNPYAKEDPIYHIDLRAQLKTTLVEISRDASMSNFISSAWAMLQQAEKDKLFAFLNK